jgi:hypothetical protein
LAAVYFDHNQRNMMTDRELLEAAAEAAGIGYNDRRTSYPSPALYRGASGPAQDQGWWNPLDNDGDALRLLSRMCMNIRHEDPDAVIAGWTEQQRTPITRDQHGPWFWKEWLRDHGDDRAAATRRAIVRAAAEIAAQTKGPQ